MLVRIKNDNEQQDILVNRLDKSTVYRNEGHIWSKAVCEKDGHMKIAEVRPLSIVLSSTTAPGCSFLSWRHNLAGLTTNRSGRRGHPRAGAHPVNGP